MISTVAAPATNQCACDVNSAASATDADSVTGVHLRISQNTTPRTQINIPTRRVESSKLVNRKISLVQKVGLASIGAVFGWVAGTWMVDNKLFSVIKTAITEVGIKIGSLAASFGSFTMAHPFATGGCAVGCVSLAIGVHYLQRFMTPKVHILENFTKKFINRHSNRMVNVNATAKRDVIKYPSLERFQMPDSSESETESDKGSIQAHPLPATPHIHATKKGTQTAKSSTPPMNTRRNQTVTPNRPKMPQSDRQKTCSRTPPPKIKKSEN
ncbi:MAG: hypothetical protein LBB15_02390 [Puniceicoccales bacterium]|jgi:hypothetical protein|nr:hypothetical protein [Puniceicoccales bacterium]